jgi:cell division septum initiation protein DivIVA
MLREITPNAIRNATLKRRLRGYDRQETEKLLAEVAQSYEKVRAESEVLSERVGKLLREQEERELRSRAELDKLKEELSDRDRRVSDLEAQIARLEAEHSKQLEDLERLGEELSSAQRTQETDQAELAEQRESVARLEIREKALVEQIAMLEGQLQQEEATQAMPTDRQLPSHRDDRAAATLLRLDRVVETVARETRREAEMTLKKARERADEILHAAEARRQRLEAEIARSGAIDETHREEYDPVAALDRVDPEPRVADRPEQEVGEASWTSRVGLDQIPERSQ